MEKAVVNSSSQSITGDNDQTDKRENPMSPYNPVPAIQQQAQFTCSLYISRAGGLQDQGHGVPGDTL